MKLAVVGDGIVAAFAAAAGQEFGWEVHVYSQRGKPTLPPPGAFYLYDIPNFMKPDFRPYTQLETVFGDELHFYTERLWGRRLTSSLDKLYNEVVLNGAPRRLTVWDPVEPLINTMFDGAYWHQAKQDQEGVESLAERYDLVALAAPIPFTTPPEFKSVPVIKLGTNPVVPSRDEDVAAALHLLGLDETIAIVTGLSSRYNTPYLTVYNASAHSYWLRATRFWDSIMVELDPAVTEQELWGTYRDSAVAPRDAFLKQLKMVKKIPPGTRKRNVAPMPNVILCGRWASWDRHELSHETYRKVKNQIIAKEVFRGE